ncbi:MAG TPA: hypothetical protein VFV75_06830, partial [Candidatus Polarisedimenticolaceae bacterium]|nr:hypothetical protein [Candidatus Polarisedimenticolaceae bacterium]
PPLEPHPRVGSGTTWQPEETPMFALHWSAGGWSMATHGLLFLVYDHQGGPRGVTRGVAPNWVMNMARRPLGPGEMDLRAMLSLDPATVRPRGYPLLFQTGETFEGKPLVDAQHPHDFFMELAGIYTWRLGERTGLQVYAAPVGEPALGPVAFPHRTSAAELPVAVLAHHNQDSTHISFGVLTAGVIAERFKVEGSWFNGHEPDEQRWGFDPIHLNSTAARLSFAPGRRWVFQASRGWLDSPEELAPGRDVTRTTASALYTRTRDHGMLAGALILGRNREEEEAGTDREDGVTLEGTLTYGDRNHVSGRYERVDRTGLVDVSDPESDPEVAVQAFTVGWSRDVAHLFKLPLAAGVAFTVYDKPDVLDPVYGDSPTSAYVYLRLRAPRMEMGTGEGMHGTHRMH